MTIGEKIKEIRREKGITQGELAARLGVSQAMITQYENGTRGPKKFDTVKKIARALDVSADDILGRELIHTMEEESQKTAQFEQIVIYYTTWLNAMGFKLAMPIAKNFEDEENQMYVLADIDGASYDLSEVMDAVMQMGAEHFKVIAKQLGKKL